MARQYWLNLFSAQAWDEAQARGGEITGFTAHRWATVQKIRPGDWLLCYMVGISRFFAILEVTGPGYRAEEQIWSEGVFPCRVPVKKVLSLPLEQAVPVHDLLPQLSFGKNLTSPHAWTARFRGSPALFGRDDGETIAAALREAATNAVWRPFDERLLRLRPRGVETDRGTVTVPQAEAEEPSTEQSPAETTPHTQMQALLLHLGHGMGMNVWVARNDRSREWRGRKLGDYPGLLDILPIQFDDATRGTIELIDVLWLKKNTIVAAFEVEHSTSIYSGLLRMADLISLQPNISIPLYIVAPDERREKVMREINRPTFARLSSPLPDFCRYISFKILQERVEAAEKGGFLAHLKADFIDTFAEDCAL